MRASWSTQEPAPRSAGRNSSFLIAETPESNRSTPPAHAFAPADIGFMILEAATDPEQLNSHSAQRQSHEPKGRERPSRLR
jgi:hypothetical protein